MDFNSFKTAIESMGFSITKFSGDSKHMTITCKESNTSMLIENKDLEHKFASFAEHLKKVGANQEHERIERLFDNIKLYQ